MKISKHIALIVVAVISLVSLFALAEDTQSICEVIAGQDGLINSSEVMTAVGYWRTQTPVPGTGGQMISSSELMTLLGLWAEQQACSTIGTIQEAITVEVPEGSGLHPSDVSMTTLVSPPSPVGVSGEAAVSVLDSPVQLVMAVSTQGNPVLLGYVFGPGVLSTASTTGARSQLSELAAFASPAPTVSVESTALSLVMLDPSLGTAPAEVKADIAARILSSAQFPNLVDLLTNAIRNDPDDPLNADRHPELYQLSSAIAASVFTDLISTASTTTSSYGLEPEYWTSTTGPEIGDHLVNEAPEIINATAVSYGIYIQKVGNTDSSQALVNGLFDGIRGRKWKWFQWPPGPERDNIINTTYSWADRLDSESPLNVEFTMFGMDNDSEIGGSIRNLWDIVRNVMSLVVGIRSGGPISFDLQNTILTQLGESAIRKLIQTAILSEGDPVAMVRRSIGWFVNSWAENTEAWAYIMREFISHQAASSVGAFLTNVNPILKAVSLATTATEQVPFWHGLVSCPKQVKYQIQISADGQVVPYEGQEPVARITASYPEGHTVPARVEFDASESTDDGEIRAYEWDFDEDGVTDATGVHVSQIFGVAGWHTVQVTVRDDTGLENSATISFQLFGQATNDIRVTLTWNRLVDMDLHITTPSEYINYTNTSDSYGGELDHDIVDPSGWTAPYQENITWQAGEAPSGTYKVGVDYYSPHGDTGPTEVTVVVRLHEGSSDEIHREFGPYTIDHHDFNDTDPGAWWKVIQFSFPDGEFSEVTASLPLGTMLQKDEGAK